MNAANATNSLQAAIEAKGRQIFARMRGETARVFSSHTLAGRVLDWSMRNEALKVQMLRFVDVLPSLQSSADVARHAREYLGDDRPEIPTLVRWALRLSPSIPWLTAFAARQSVQRIARIFILARDPREVLLELRARRRWPLAFTIDLLGETAVSEAEADAYAKRYLDLIDRLADEAKAWPVIEQIDRDQRGELPKVNVSVKISALNSQIHPADPEGAIEILSARLRPLLSRAKERGVFINFDMESTGLKDLTFELFKRLLDEPALREYEHAGLALQAYLRDSERDLDGLIEWAQARQRRITVRLIKGAYWDYEMVMAKQRGWPVPVFERKAQTDANYERLARKMLENEQVILCAFGTHSVRSIAACLVQAEQLGRSPRAFEIQMLYGMAEPIKHALITLGYRLRDYCPIGELLPGMGYLVRRLLENTSNEGFLRATFSEHWSPDELLRDPAKAVDEGPRAKVQGPRSGKQPGLMFDRNASLRSQALVRSFKNEPPTDFTKASNRSRMVAALRLARGQLGRKFPLVIGGEEIWTEKAIVSINPARPSEVIGSVSRAGQAQANSAVESARAAFHEWRRTSVEARAQVLERAAEEMRRRRFELAALEVFEVGKAWAESDADVTEAIDFCNFYAQEMRRIAISTYAVPGETSAQHYIPRGVAVVISPWNFPLAILCGMTTAALVAGNTVIIKPSGQSAIIGARFMEMLQAAGLPPGVANFLPGSGAEIGDYLVNHPQVDLIAFTGSREVGLRIYEAAGKTAPGQIQLKKVICEMGGKNAVIIDSDADLDDAIPAIIHSAFGYQGQKCSALSRLIVLRENFDRVLSRLIAACRNLRLGLPEEPGTVVGPVIDRASFDRVRQYIELGKGEAELAFQGETPSGDGYFVPPAIFKNVPPHARIAQEEIFGPMLSVIKADNLDKAIAIANNTQYALTGGFFSRSPANIDRVKAEIEVGNLYINRGITGALVARHPFGGFKMSGGGTKAGGSDYLQHFLFPRVVTENLMRHGFAPTHLDGEYNEPEESGGNR